MSAERVISPETSLARIPLNAEKVAGLLAGNQAFAALDDDAIRGPFSPAICGEIDLVWVRTPGKKKRYLRVVNGHNRTNAAYDFQQTEEGKDFELIGRDFTAREKRALPPSDQEELTPEEYFIVASRKKKKGQVDRRLAGHTLTEFGKMVDESHYPLSALAAVSLFSFSDLRSVPIDNLEEFLRTPRTSAPENRITRLQPTEELAPTDPNSSIVTTLHRLAYEIKHADVKYEDVLSSMLAIFREEPDDQAREDLLRQQVRGFLDFPEVSQKIDQAINSQTDRAQLEDGLITVLARTVGTLHTTEDVRTVNGILCNPAMDYADLGNIFAPIPSDKRSDETISIILERKDRIQNKKIVEHILGELHVKNPKMVEESSLVGRALTNLAGTDELDTKEVSQIVSQLVTADAEMKDAKKRLGSMSGKERAELENRINVLLEASTLSAFRLRIKRVKDYVGTTTSRTEQPSTLPVSKGTVDVFTSVPAPATTGSEAQDVTDVRLSGENERLKRENERLKGENEKLRERVKEFEWWNNVPGLTDMERVCAEAYALDKLTNLLDRYEDHRIRFAVKEAIRKRRERGQLTEQEILKRRRNGL